MTTIRSDRSAGRSPRARFVVGGLRVAIAAAATLGVLAIGVSAAGASATAKLVGARYKVSYGALPVGELNANVAIAPQSYKLDANFKSSGIAKLMKKTRGQAAAHGAIGASGLRPKAFAMDYTSGKKTRARSVAFAGGSVARATETPARTPPANWVPTLPQHLAGAIDPASALLVTAPGGNPCAGTAKLFDGRTRIDATMNSLGATRFRTKGYKGTAHKCAVSIAPVGGYKTGKSEQRLRGMRGVTASFVPVPGTALHMLVQLEVPTPIGTFTAKATRLSL